MAKLNKAQREDIANLIESLMVAKTAQKTRMDNGNADGKLAWWQEYEGRLTVRLFERFGIELCTLSLFMDEAA